MYSKILGKETVVTAKEPYVVVDGVKINARQTAKAINLGLNYGKSAFTLKDDLMCSEKEAQEFINLIKALFPQNEKYFAYKYRQTMAQGYIFTNSISGRRIYIEDFPNAKELIEKGDKKELHSKQDLSNYYKKKGEIQRMCQNYPIQGTAADVLKLASYYVWRYIKYHKLDAYIVNVVHDEINIICKKQ
jgi:DNA polymerase-1